MALSKMGPPSVSAPLESYSLAQEAISTAAHQPIALVYREYAPYVAAIATRLVGRPEDVDDIIQEVFVRALTGLGQLREPAAIKGWLATVTVRQAGRCLRRRRLRSFAGLDKRTSYEDLVDTAASPEQRALLARIYSILDALPVPRRLAWAMRHIEGENLESVAKLCGCSLATAKRRIAAAEAWIAKETRDD
jgi:RNA polymerase sigma-70 factor (ECF subfamily)